MPRKKKSEPSIKMRSDGRYQISIDCGRNFDGSRKRKVFYAKTPQEVQEKANKARAQIDCGIFKFHKGMRFEAFAMEWVNGKMGTVEEATHQNYVSTLRNHLLPALGGFSMEEIKYQHIQMILNTMAANGKGKGTIQNTKTLCSCIFNDAIKADVIDRNPAALSDMPKKCKPSNVRAPLNDEQLQAVIEHWSIVPTIGLPTLVMIFAGLRPSEMMALNWSDFNLTDGTVRVNKALSHDKQRKIKEPKTQSGNRFVDIPAVLIPALKEAFKQTKTTLFLEPNDNGYIEYSAFAKKFAAFLQAVSLESGVNFYGITPYCCRHTYATIAYAAGCSPKATQGQMGHANIAMTLGTYTHISRQSKSADSEKFNSACDQIFIPISKNVHTGSQW